MTRNSIFSLIIAHLTEKKQVLQQSIDDLRAGMANDGKSSAGDKYETSREMAQQEIQQLSIQLSGIQQHLIGLHQLQELATSFTAQHGSVVETDTHYYVLGIPFGQCSVNTKTAVGIGVKAPVYAKFMGKSTEDQLEMGIKKEQIIGLH